MAVSASVSVSSYATVTQNVLGNFTGRVGITHDEKLSTVTKVHASPYTGTQTLDVTADLSDPFGSNVNFGTVKALHVKNKHSSTNLVVTGDLLYGDQYTVGPGRTVYIDTSRTVDSSHKVLTLTGTSVPYDLLILGS